MPRSCTVILSTTVRRKKKIDEANLRGSLCTKLRMVSKHKRHKKTPPRGKRFGPQKPIPRCAFSGLLSHAPNLDRSYHRVLSISETLVGPEKTIAPCVFSSCNPGAREGVLVSSVRSQSVHAARWHIRTILNREFWVDWLSQSRIFDRRLSGSSKVVRNSLFMS